MGYEGMRLVRRATHAPAAATSVAVRSDQAHGIPTGFRPPARGCGGTPLPREDHPTPPAQPQRGCVLQGRDRGNRSPARWLPPRHNPFGVDAIGGVTRPKVAPCTSGQPWAPGRNRVAVARPVRGAAPLQNTAGCKPEWTVWTPWTVWTNSKMPGARSPLLTSGFRPPTSGICRIPHNQQPITDNPSQMAPLTLSLPACGARGETQARSPLLTSGL